MLYSQASAFMRSRGDLLLSGNLQALSASYLFPLPIFLAANRLVVRSPDEVCMVFSLLRTALVERGVVALEPKVTAMDLPRAGRFRVWVDWHELTVPVEDARYSSAVYYCKSGPSGPQIEMVNYTRLSMPELKPRFAALALSA